MATTTRTKPLTSEIPMITSGDARRREAFGQFLILLSLIVLLVLTLVPIVLMIFFSLKDNGQIYGRFWGMPNPVRWEESIRHLAAQRVEQFIEVGPGKVLTGLLRGIDRSLKGTNVEDIQTLEALSQ